jgi:hypothetical protein
MFLDQVEYVVLPIKLACHIASLIAVGGVLVRLMGLPRNLRSRRMPRLMLCLILVSIIRHTVYFVKNLTDIISGREYSAVWFTCMVWFGFLAEASVFWMEFAISVAFLVRKTDYSGRVAKWLPLLALIMAATPIMLEASLISACHKDWLEQACQHEQRKWSGLLAGVTCSASIICFLIVGIRSRARGCVQERNWARALLFACHALVTQLPFIALAVSELSHPDSKERLKLHTLFLRWINIPSALSGVGIAITVLWQSRYANPEIADVARLTTTRSFNVHWGGVEEVAIV